MRILILKKQGLEAETRLRFGSKRKECNCEGNAVLKWNSV